MNGRKGFMSDINVTPLVDVMLVLLIIFMVTAPMMMQGIEVNLPETQTRYIKSREEPLILSITKDKKIYIENHPIGIEKLEPKLKTIFKYRKNKELLIRADKRLPYGFVIKVIAGVKRAGIDRVGVVTEPLEQ